MPRLCSSSDNAIVTTDTRTELIANGRTLVVCCEGLCSHIYSLPETTVTKYRAAGWSPSEVRADVTARLKATTHQESKRLVNERSRAVVVFARCLGCGHERQVGLEEL